MANYKLLEGSMHEQIYFSRKKIQVIGGGFGNGKTTAAVIKGLKLAKEYPGSNGLVAMATYKQLTDTIQKAFLDWVPASSVDRYPSVADPTMKLKNGSRINFRYIKQKGKAASADGQTTSNLLSATYDWAIVDQLENPEITHKDFLDLLGRMRGSTPYVGTDETMPRTGPRWVILCVNPSFNWVYHKLIKPYHIWKASGEITKDLIVNKDNEPLLEVYEGSTYENAHNLEPDFIETMEAAYKGQFRKRYLGGEYGAFEGLIYPEFDRDFHVISKSKMMAYLIRLNHQRIKPLALEGFDFGIASPSCYLFGFTDDLGRVFILDGFHKPEMDIPSIGMGILNIQLQYSGLVNIDRPIYADPSIFKRSVIDHVGKKADTIKSILANSFQLDFVAGQNAILSGIAKVNSYINIKTFPNFEDDKQLNGGVFYIASHLAPIIEEFASYFWKTQNNERIDEPIDANDHGMDAIKYMLSYLPDVKALMYITREKLWSA